MFTTPLSDQLGIRVPIWNAGMGGGLAGVELACAVSGAGGLGVLGMGGLPTAATREFIQQLKARTDAPYGVNLIMPLLDEGQVECCIDEEVPVLILFWGDAGPYVEKAHAAGTKVVVQVGSVEAAKDAAAAGVDAVMVQGVEAGGHNGSETGLAVIVPATVSAIAPIPVIAAGGIADGRGIAAMIDMGAQGVSLGTRFLCSDESRAAAGYKERIVSAMPDQTLHTKLFDGGWPNAAHRVLRNNVVQTWEDAGSPASGQRPGEGDNVGRMPVAGQDVELTRYGIFMPMDGFEGDLEDQVLYCGQSCGLIDDIKPAAEIMRSLSEEADAILSGRSA
ncbi:nitronate monooxygenase/enoyl-[acyl-carrier protein] reductase II [Antricoccus suffuscus]|uniref:Nitronate monooxygenase/enoyl-[acyl-carrier protein] reductase II n=1 Tax=Antricoccus suffuscus TaxID=1629062 RepID=A0A2T1A765_9ACTN|nr:nitronate monooxygenase [Antricoccus suffuscus]PRZ44317.1 nitronate monooxygenase/enoyl-[acyl-carrier protein] reductase II [Antricoccus suffuscus]